ncbi:Alpha/Beta hydrolase protein [Mycena leptocephala]|nr:Alpha/Beta hydrolase protein [Mycena leptocephala]
MLPDNFAIQLLALALFSSSAFATPSSSSVSRAAAEPRGLVGTLTSKLGPVVNLGYAAYAGNATLPDVTFYGGIPYIKPPVGNLRFAPPQKLDETPKFTLSNDDVVDARNWGPLCIQQPAVMGIGNEDCVTLNIWTPSNATSKSKLPVYVYIHGGGHYYNSAQGFPANDWVARSGGGLIAIGLQYRLGLLGYLSGSAIVNNPTSGPNNGLFDQRAGLEWIQRHIAAFGGDPTKVTIGGESSGGGSVALHLTAYGGEKNPPFRAAVIESPGNDPFYTLDHTEQCFGNVTKQVGCDGASDIVACLRKASIGAIVSAVNNKPSTCKYEPVIDGGYIPDITSKLLSAGKFTKVPILAGHNARMLYLRRYTPVYKHGRRHCQCRPQTVSALSKATTDAMLVTYPLHRTPLLGRPNGNAPCTRTWRASSDAGIIISVTSAESRFQLSLGRPDPNLLAARGAYVGAAHTAELFYLYDGTNSGPSASVAQPVFTVFNPRKTPWRARPLRGGLASRGRWTPTRSPSLGHPPGTGVEGGFMVPNSATTLRRRAAPWLFVPKTTPSAAHGGGALGRISVLKTVSTLASVVQRPR